MYKPIFILALTACLPGILDAQKINRRTLTKEISGLLSRQPGVYAVAFKDVQNGKTIYIHEQEFFHAASTMKTPVLIEAYRQAAAGKIGMRDSVTIFNYFKSIADTSHFFTSAADDSETALYQHIGAKITLFDLLYRMIISSSNLATNMLVEKLGAENVMATMRSLGAGKIQVLRGVEDTKAFQLDMNNRVTAFDLALIFYKMGKGEIVSQAACDEMINILLDQQFNSIIPARLPASVKVAHKTGSITGIHHDSGIVFLPDGRKYVLVLLAKDFTDDKGAVESMATVSKMIYDYMMAH